MNAIPNRVSVVDKRIFQGKADVNALLPLRYPWAYTAYVDANKNHWLPGDIHFDLDRVDHTTQGYWIPLSTFLIELAELSELNRQQMLFVYKATTAPEVRQRFLRMGQEDTMAIFLVQTMELGMADFIPSSAVTVLDTEQAYMRELLAMIKRKVTSLAKAKYLMEEVALHANISKAVSLPYRDLESQFEFLLNLLRTFLGECESHAALFTADAVHDTGLFQSSLSPHHAHLNSRVLNILDSTTISPSPYGIKVEEKITVTGKDTLTWD